MDIKLAERSLFYSTYPNFKRSITHENILYGAISSLYIRAQEITAQISASAACSAHRLGHSPNRYHNGFWEHPPWRKMQYGKRWRDLKCQSCRSPDTASHPGRTAPCCSALWLSLQASGFHLEILSTMLWILPRPYSLHTAHISSQPLCEAPSPPSVQPATFIFELPIQGAWQEIFQSKLWMSKWINVQMLFHCVLHQDLIGPEMFLCFVPSSHCDVCRHFF